MSLFSRLFPKAAEMNAVMDHVNELEDERAKLKRELKELWGNYHTVEAGRTEALKALDELKRKLRDQNEADLLFVSVQIARRLLAGESKSSNAMESLLAQQQALSASLQSYRGSPLYDAFGGLGNLFGARWPQ